MWSMLGRRLARWGGLASSALCGCTTWTSLHAGYGLAPGSERSVGGLEVRRAFGGSLHAGYGLLGARLDGGARQIDAEIHAGAMRPLRLSEEFTLVPSVTVDLARVSNLRGRWYGGAFGPGVATELLWWLHTERRTYEGGDPFGCMMGGARGVDCPRGCQVQDVIRHGIGFRVAAEYDLRFSGGPPRSNDWIVWFSVGGTRAASRREQECCYFDHEPPLRRDCTLMP